MLPVAALLGAGLLAALSAASRDGPDRRGDASGGAAVTFGDDLRLAGLAEAIEDARINAALGEFAALQTLAALAAWPQPDVPAPPAAAARAPSAQTPRFSSGRTEPWTDAALAAAILDAVNARRAAAGLPAVRYDSRVAQAASSYALRMISLDSFGHSVDGSTIASRLAAAGFTDPVRLGEVLAWSSAAPSAASMVQTWLDSPVHRDQILSASYRIAGAGCAFAGGKVNCVVDLAG